MPLLRDQPHPRLAVELAMAMSLRHEPGLFTATLAHVRAGCLRVRLIARRAARDQTVTTMALRLTPLTSPLENYGFLPIEHHASLHVRGDRASKCSGL